LESLERRGEERIIPFGKRIIPANFKNGFLQ
jgi:hypothetical protein